MGVCFRYVGTVRNLGDPPSLVTGDQPRPAPGQLAKYNQALPRDKLCVYFFGPEPDNTRYGQILSLMTSANIEMYSFDGKDGIRKHQTFDPRGDVYDDFLSTHVEDAPGHALQLTELRKVFKVWVAEKQHVCATDDRALKATFIAKLGDIYCNTWKSPKIVWQGGHLTGWRNKRLVEPADQHSMQSE